jgi:Protein of unknown function, DUF
LSFSRADAAKHQSTIRGLGRDRLNCDADQLGQVLGVELLLELGAEQGHVPAAALRRLLAEKPKAAGLAVPGMPIGSPGMKGGKPEKYDVILFGSEGRRTYMSFIGEQSI